MDHEHDVPTRAKWIALENGNAVTQAELKELIADSYRLVVAKLPKKTREELTALPVKRRSDSAFRLAHRGSARDPRLPLCLAETYS